MRPRLGMEPESLPDLHACSRTWPIQTTAWGEGARKYLSPPPFIHERLHPWDRVATAHGAIAFFKWGATVTGLRRDRARMRRLIPRLTATSKLRDRGTPSPRFNKAMALHCTRLRHSGHCGRLSLVIGFGVCLRSSTRFQGLLNDELACGGCPLREGTWNSHRPLWDEF